MIAMRLLRGGTCAIALGALTAAAAVPAGAACRGFVQATAEGTFQTPTEIVARARWRSEVREAHGGEFARWSLAKVKTMRCTKIQAGNRWTCLARARPCDG
jgi:hypothetical protein